MVSLPKFAEIGQVGDSLTTGNEGFLNAVKMQLLFATSLATQYIGSSPLPPQYGLGSPAPASATTFNRGAPSWHVYASDAQIISQIRTFIQQLPTSVTHLIIEGGTNDATGGTDPNVSNTALLGCFTDAIARFPALQAIFVIGVACAGELWALNGMGQPAFAGNPLLGGTVDAAIDTQNALLSATTVAQVANNRLGHPITFVWVDMRTPCIAFEVAAEPVPPGVAAGPLTVDGRHPQNGGLNVVFQAAMLSSITVVP